LARLGCDEDWIVQRSGIRQRRHLPTNMAASDMAVVAAQNAIDASRSAPEEIDLLIAATYTPDRLMPSLGCTRQGRLGLACAAMDLNAACSGFVYALVTAQQFVHSGSCRKVLVAATDVATRVTNPDDKKTYPLFGDAAGAVVVGGGEAPQGLVAYNLGADGSGGDLLQIPGGGSKAPLTSQSLALGDQFMKMDGRAIFKWAVRQIADSAKAVLDHADMSLDEVRWIILHQANVRILDAAADALGANRDKVVVNLDRYGNTSSGSIPLALDEVYRDGQIEPGDHILIGGFGAGLTWGAMALRW